MMSKISTELLAQALMAEVIEEGLKAAQSLSSENVQNDNTLRYVYREKLSVTASILATVLPGICPADVMHVFENVPQQEINPWCGVNECEIESVLSKIHAYKREVHKEIKKYKMQSSISVEN